MVNDIAVQEFVKAIKEEPQDTNKTYNATVSKVDGEGVVWVNIHGSDKETPTSSTSTEVKRGDSVTVNWRNNKLYIGGNYSNPSVGIGTVAPSVNYVNDLIDKDISVASINAATGYIGDLTADNITTENIKATNGYIQYLVADDITAEDISASSGYIKDLQADSITASDISAASGYIKDLESENITAENIIADHETVGSLDANYAHITNGVIDNAKIGHADVNGLNANYAHITSGVIDNAKIGYADVNNLNAHYAEIDMANVNNAWIDHGAMKKAEVFDGNVFDLSGDKATIKRIDASKINVANLRADNLVVRRINGQPVVGGYTLIDSNSSGYSSKNPQALGWYEFVNAQWVLSTDTTVDMTKAYYQEGNEVSLYDQQYIDDMENDLQQQIDGAVETFTGSVVPTLVNYPYTEWYDTSVTPTKDERAKHVGDIYYVVNSAVDENGYCYRFAYDNTTHAYSWVLIKDSDVTKALSDISDLQEFESTTTSWIDETDEGLETIRTNHTALAGVVDKTVKESVQLWFTKANTTAPDKPTAEVTSTSTAGNAWRKVVPAYNASYPNYFYCWQYKFVDDTFDWSAVVRDIAMGETQGTARDAKNTADAALPASTFTSFESTTFKDVKDNVNEHSVTFTNMTSRLGMNSDGTGANTDVVAKESALETTVDGIKTRVGKTETKLIGMYATSSTAEGTAAKVATITPALPSGATWELGTGTIITVKFTNANTAANPTLNVNSKGAKAIKTYANGTLTEAEYKWKAGSTFTFTYNGTNWLMQDSSASVRMNSAETSITQTADSIISLASGSTTYTKPDGTTATSAIGTTVSQTANNVLIKATRAGATDAEKSAGGTSAAALINVTPDTVKIAANHVEITGTAVFNAVDSDASAKAAMLNSELEIGGRNFIRNTGAFSGWTNCGTGTAGTFDTDNGIFTYPATTADGWTEIRPNANVPYNYVRDKEVTLSAEVKGTSGQVLSVMIDPYVSTTIAGDRSKYKNVYLKTDGGSTASSNTVTADGTWQKVYATVTINDAFFTGGSATVDFDSCYFGARASRYNTNHNAYSIRHIKIEKGNKATDWTPAPEDVDAQIDNLEIGGRNLLSNSQTITKTWSKDNATVSDGVATVTCVNSGDARIYQTPSIGYWTWQANQDYTVSVDAKASASGLKFYFNAVGLSKVSSDVALTTDWKRYTWTVSATSVSTETGSISFVAKNGQSGTVQFRNPKLEYGNKATDWTPAPEDAVDEEQYIYISKASGTTSILGTTTWITENEDKQNTWSTKRPTYNSSYPVLFVAKQKKNVGGTVACTTPIKDDTTTVIDGGNIITGSVTANQLSANAVTADKIAIGAIEEYENILLDSDAPTTTKVKASYDRYFSDGANNKIVCSNFTLTDAPEQGLKYGRRFVYDGSVATDNYFRGYAFYSNGTNNSIPLVPNQTYTATWWARCTSGSGRTRFLHSKGDGATGTVSGTIYTLSRYWKKCTYSFTFGSTLNTNYNRIWFHALFPKSTAGTVEICGCKLTVGDDSESYITRINSDGIRIHPSSTENNSVVINSNGMEIFKGGASVAYYGDTSRVGEESGAHLDITADSISGISSSGNEYFQITEAGGTSTNWSYIRIDNAGAGYITNTSVGIGFNLATLSQTSTIWNAISSGASFKIKTEYFGMKTAGGDLPVSRYKINIDTFTKGMAGNATYTQYSTPSTATTKAAYPTLPSGWRTFVGKRVYFGYSTTVNLPYYRMGVDTAESGGGSSVAMGTGTIADGDNQLALGKYNAAGSNALVVVGYGSSASNRSNVLTISKSGSVDSASYIYAGDGIISHGDVSSTNGYKSHGHSSAIGTVKKTWLSSAKSVANNTPTALCSLSLEAGVWIVTGLTRAPVNATGLRVMNIATASGHDAYEIVMPAVSGTYTQLHHVRIYEFSSTTTVYLNVIQTSGGALTYPVGSSNGQNALTAVRIQ